MLENLAEGIARILVWQSILFIFTGTIVGIIIGAIPGLTISMGLAIFVPFTFFLPPLYGIPFLIGLYKGGLYGGSISAVLIGAPGHAGAAATVMDGHPLAQQGFARRALQAALNSSIVGDLIGTFALVLVAPELAKIALKFSPADFTGLIIFSFMAVATVSGGSLLKGWISALIGFFFVIIGPDVWTGTPRFSFGFFELAGGFSIVPLTIGLFAFSKVLIEAEKGAKKMLAEQKIAYGYKGDKSKFGFLETFKHYRLVAASSLQGVFLGALPAIGAPIACWTAYATARWMSKEPDKFGKGAIEGVIGPETANNATAGGAMIPMMVFGIPGDVATAILLGAFIAQGLRPSPVLFQENPSLLYGLFVAMYLATVAMWLCGTTLIPVFTRIMNVKRTFLYPLVIMFCLVGSYAVQNSLVDVVGMVFFGVLGYLAVKYGYPLPPIAVGFVLGQILERNFRAAIVISRGNPLTFLSSPISAGFMVASLVVMIGSIVWASRKNRQIRQPIGD